MTVFIVSEVRLYQEGLRRALAADERLEPVGTASRCGEAASAIAALPEPPAVVLLDLAIADGLHEVRRLVERFARTRTVALAVREVDEDVISWAEAGVDAMVTREASLATLQNTVESVVDGVAPVSPRVGAALMRRLAALSTSRPTAPRVDERLTTRERQVGALMRDGLTNKEIAAELFIELSTVKHHVHNVLEKLDARSRAEAAGKISAWHNGG